MLLDYHEIDHSPMASQQEKWLLERAHEVELYGMSREQFDSMHPDIYARFLAGTLQYDV